MQDLVPRPGIQPTPPAVEARSLNHWTARGVPSCRCTCPALPRLFPTINRQPHIHSGSPPGSRHKMPMHRDHFYRPGLSDIYLSPRTYFPCTHISFSSVFHNPSSHVFHHFSSTSPFSSLKPLLAIPQSLERGQA